MWNQLFRFETVNFLFNLEFLVLKQIILSLTVTFTAPKEDKPRKSLRSLQMRKMKQVDSAKPIDVAPRGKSWIFSEINFPPEF